MDVVYLVVVYLVIWEDRHQDAVIYARTIKEDALRLARKIVDEQFAEYGEPQYPEDCEPMSQNELDAAGILFSQSYNGEGDRVWVQESTVDDPSDFD